VASAATPRIQDAPLPPNAAKAAPSYYAVKKAISDVVDPWSQPGATVPPAAPGWQAFFGALEQELGTYASQADAKGRLRSLNRLHQMDMALWGITWAPALKVRAALDEWLTPRIRVAWAERNLIDYVESRKAASDAALENHRRWVKFVGEDLGSSLAAYESAKTVQARRAALKKLTGVLGALRANNRTVAWTYSAELQAAVDNLHSLPNIDLSADVASVAPFLSQNVVQNGPIYRDGYVAQVTAGQKTGFALLPSDEGIAFYNSQLASTYTPITDFQQQLEQDKRGRKVAKLYYFSAVSTDAPEVQITTIIRPTTGIELIPNSTHAVGAGVAATPTEGHGLGRAFLGILGFNRDKLTEKIREQAYPRMVDGVIKGAAEEASERSAAAQAQLNANLRKVLPGDGSMTVQDFRVSDVSFRTRPENVLVGGLLGHKTLPDAIGADMPQPSSLLTPAAGVSADIHLGSLLSNAVGGLLLSDKVKGVDNLLIVTKAVEPGAPPREGITIGKNVDYAAFLKAGDEARAANNPKVQALRIKKPTVPPEFAADERGFLVILVRDFQLEVPAPPGGLLGGRSKAIRFSVPTAEFVLSFHTPNGEAKPTEIDAKLEDFVPSPGSKVQTLGDTEDQVQTLGPFQANLALAAFKTKLQQTPIKVPLTNLKIPGFDLREISPLDPSGWIRVVLTPNGEPINLPAPGGVTASAEAPTTASAEVSTSTPR
jgi:hypothetical protein